MAEAALSKSLDDIIAEQRKKSGNKGKDRGDKKQARGGRPEVSKKNARDSKPKTAPKVLTVTINRKSGAIAKKGRDDRRRQQRPIIDPQQTNPELRMHALEGSGKWGHDMYVQIEGSRATSDMRTASPLGTKL